MANEFKHGSVGTSLSQAEWEAIGTHVLDSQATGDIIYASSASQLRRLGIGSNTNVLTLAAGVPSWAAPAAAAAGSLTGSTLASGVTASSLTSVGTIATGVWQGTDVGVAYGGTGVSTLASNSVLTGNGASAIVAEANLTFDGSNLFLANTIGMVVGHSAQVTSDSQVFKTQILGTTTADSGILIGRFDDGGGAPRIRFLKSRAPIGSFAIVEDDDILGEFDFHGDDGVTYNTRAAQFHVEVDDATPVGGSGGNPGGIGAAFVWKQQPGGGTTAAQETMRIAADGTVKVSTGSIDLNSQSGITNVGYSGNDWDSNGLRMVIPTYAPGTDLTTGMIISNVNYPNGRTIIGQYSGEPYLTMYSSGNNLSVSFGAIASYSRQAIRIGADADVNAFDNETNGAGSTTMYIGNETITTSSDERLKTAIRPTQANALDLVNRFNVVDFEWDDPTDTVEYGKNYRGRYTGMLAQETVKIAPWIINDQGGGRDCSECLAGQDCEEHGMWIVSYQNLVPTLVKAIQELSQEVRNGHN